MRRRLRPLSAPEPHLMGHLRSTVWGPAEFVGPPPWWLVGEGFLAGVLGAAAIVGTAVFGAWTGRPALADGEAGLVCALALALYLVLVRAGRAMVGIVTVLGFCLALQAPQAAAGVVLAERGRVESMVVTSVHGGGAGNGWDGRYLCSVADRGGVPLRVRIWRGCEQTTRPGDALAVVYDPGGQVPPRGVEKGTGALRALRGLSGWVAALVTGSVVAVVRSYRLSVPPPERESAVSR
ncbi:hypothetical protein ACFYO0_34590 [Streptomyces sp. NPDC006365]|uniref:hypothetical protein n=1 Tax=Streptomyces sp. NPDC006365 TaxID=3364744 RepID=UPI0036C53EA1